MTARRPWRPRDRWCRSPRARRSSCSAYASTRACCACRTAARAGWPLWSTTATEPSRSGSRCGGTIRRTFSVSPSPRRCSTSHPGSWRPHVVRVRAPRPRGGTEVTRPFMITATDGRSETQANGSMIQSAVVAPAGCPRAVHPARRVGHDPRGVPAVAGGQRRSWASRSTSGTWRGCSASMILPPCASGATWWTWSLR